ncbi:MAG: FAD:protein FMN transferase [Treponema sp.]
MKKYILLWLLILASICSCKQKERRVQRVEFAFDTVCSIQVFTDNMEEKEVQKILDEAFAKLKRLENIFSPTLKESELYKLNENTSTNGIPLSPELHYLIEESLHFAHITSGAFNPCIASLTKLWQPLWKGEGDIPTKEEINEALHGVDYTDCVFKNNDIIKTPYIKFDLGASAKGYATDCIKTLLNERGIKKAIIDLGGNIFVAQEQGNSKMKVGIKSPILHETGKVAGYVEVKNKAVVTSGNYERFFEKDEKLYHHILSSNTGYPVENELRAVTIISDSAMLSDILSTSCFVLGVEKSKSLLENFPEASAIFFLNSNEIIEVNNISSPFKLLDSRFTITKNTF